MDRKKTFTTKDTAYIGLSAVFIAVCSYISVPTAIPFTMQIFAVFFAFDFLGWKKGTLAVCIYLMLGLLGLPIYSNGTSGIGILLGINGGYMIGWVISGFSMGLSGKLFGRKLRGRVLSMLVGLLVCYIAGTAWYMAAYARTSGSVGLWTALSTCVVPFVIPDIIKLGLALWLSERLRKITGKLF